ncbi:MAG: hypothetical protein NTX15_09840, partial [Candidatus Kapabacteria bacterium]|nr:hypothetical protein [Candidatus Kapabacteria bacterium]
MNDSWTARLSNFSNGLVGVIAVLVVVQMVSGVLLSMWYVPSRAPAVTSNGSHATISYGSRIERVGSFTDTLGVDGVATLLPARSGDVVPSAAGASVAVDVANAPGGHLLRSIHHNNTGWMYGLGALWFLLLIVRVAYRAEPSAWWRAVVFLTLIIIGAWSGRLLPDDVYSEISRRIVGHELQEAPFGKFFASLFGVDPVAPLISRTWVMHVLTGTALLAAFWKPLSAMRGAASTASGVSRYWASRGLALTAIVVASALLPPAVTPVRDAVGGVSGQTHIDPWWVVSPLHTLVGWFGAELTG